ncbi:MAG: serine/threonine protein kinase [Planctomycetaceae bacterium]|nr:serine/threonine protein kinase [Planctomycetaceae bacterium]
MRYRIVEELGSSDRRRYRAVDSHAGFNGEQRAILDLPNTSATRQHLRVLKRLRNLGLPRVIETFRRSDRTWVVMEWIDGPTLASYLDRMKANSVPRISVTEAFRLIRHLAHSLHSIHRRRQIAHGDIKPENLIVARDPSRLVLIDFGSAWLAEKTDRRELGDGFHAAYAAPELQTADCFVDWRSDLFSVGVILYELITLVLPYQFGGKAGRPEYAGRMSDKLIPPSRLHPDAKSVPKCVWQGIDRVAAKSLAFHPDARYLTPQAWLDDLDAVDLEIRRPTTLTAANARFTRFIGWIADGCRSPSSHR